MIWNKLKNIIKEVFGKSDKKEYLEKCVENLETRSLEDVNLPFKIIKLKNTGFVVKVSGLYAFIAFNHMPWEYNKINYWISISPKLIGKIFYCKIHSIKKEPSLSIIINGKIPQFKKTELIIGESYSGIILTKVSSGILIDIGYHFDWKCGSFVGFLHKLQIDSLKLLSSCSVGDEIEIVYQGLNENGHSLNFQTREIFDWSNGIPQGLLGQVVLVHVVREGNEKEINLLVNGKYRGRMIYKFGSKQTIRKIKNNLKDGEIIHCEVIDFNEKGRILKLKWAVELDMELFENIKNNIGNTSIINNLSDDAIQKLIAIRDKIKSTEMHVC